MDVNGTYHGFLLHFPRLKHKHRFGYAFNVDTGTSTGDISGHSKVINAVSIRNQRPYRAATASDDTTIVFHQGRVTSPPQSVRSNSGIGQARRSSMTRHDLFVSFVDDNLTICFAVAHQNSHEIRPGY